MTTHHTFCRICESLCGLEVTVEDGTVTGVRPDREQVSTRGFACIKGLRQAEMYDSPDRLQVPMRRVNGRLEPSTWEEALADIGSRVKALRAVHPDSIGMYVGTAAGFSTLHPIFAQGFMLGLGSTSLYASATQDCANKFAVANELYGFPFTQPFPDLDHTECLIVVGANPVVSKWSFLQVTDPRATLKALEARGGRLYVVDPRRTETARSAGEHVPIRPGSDVFFYLSFLHELMAQGGVDAAAVEHTRGLDAVTRLAEPWPAERTERATGIPPEKLREMVEAYRTARGAALYCSTGVNQGPHGALAFWLQEVINAVSGNLDRRGGTLVGEGVFDFPAFGKKRGLLVSEERSRVGGFGKVNDAYPGGILADEILTPGDRQLKALFVTGGNPLVTMADGDRLRRALGELDLLVVLDIYANETASVADWVLPCTSPFQRPDLPFVFPLFLGMQSRPYLQATRAVVPPRGEQRDEATIYHDLCRASGVGLFGSRTVTALLELARRVRRWRTGEPSIPQEGLLDLLLRVTGQGSFARLLRHAHGRRREVRGPGSFLPERLLTEDRKVQLAPPRYLERAGRLEAELEASSGDDRLRLISKREVRTHNSWTHNIPRMIAGQETNHVWMNPCDAAARGLVEGALADVRVEHAAIRLPVKLTGDLAPGTVAVPHGWGHQHAEGLSVASKTSGVNVNLLARSGPEAVDPLSGMSHLTALPVEVTRASGPRDVGTWSGISQAWAAQDRHRQEAG